jgi:outer membrane protein assembly complex protein YaeT
VQGGMNVRWLIAAGVGGVLFVGAGVRAAPRNEPAIANRGAGLLPVEALLPTINEIAFVGLRYISAEAVKAQIFSRVGERLDAGHVESDVKALGRLGWFDDIHVETEPCRVPPSFAVGVSPCVRLVFHVAELPYLTKSEFAGSKLLSTAQIEKLLAEQRVTLRLGEPAAPENLIRVSKTIRQALEELGHPQARVKILREESANGTLQVRFDVNDGPHIPVGRIAFEGHPEIPEKLLRREMRRTGPGALFASWRGRGVYAREGFEEDRATVLIYYQNHGFPEARVGNAGLSVYERPSSWWIPWWLCKTQKRLTVSVPIEAGPLYRVKSVEIAEDLIASSGKHGPKLLAFSKANTGLPFSVKALEDLRHAWIAAIQPKHTRAERTEVRSVASTRILDAETRTVRAQIGFNNAPPYLVRRIEFLGAHRFSDRCLRRRIGLQEGQPFDEGALEAGLARLARTGYFHQIKKEDIRVQTDDLTHTANVAIRVSEAGQQRASFSGGQGQFGSTLGLAYSLFDLLQREELLTAQLDGGPESLQVALGLVMEGFLGTRTSLAFSILNNILKPRFASSVKGPFYKSESEGLNGGWSYPLTNVDSLAVNYSLSRTNTDYSFLLPASVADLPSSDLRAKTSSSGMGLAWMHDTGAERWSLVNSASGGPLGGSENVLRSNEEYARLYPDPFFSRQNSWAFRATFSGAGNYQGSMPVYARLFSGDAQVRGLNPGELGPYAIVPTTTASSGNQTFTALPAGANVVTAANAEYRIPFGNGMQGAGFFDLGSGLLLPNWLGKTRPILLGSTNGILHGSIGFELRWTVPEIQVPVRAYYAVNVMRLNRFLPLPDGTLFHAHNRLFAFGWALGTLF